MQLSTLVELNCLGCWRQRTEAHLRTAVACPYMGSYSVPIGELVAMPTRDIAKAPEVLIITAKKIAACVECYKASRYAGHYLMTHEAINEARSLLVDVEDLMRELAARQIGP